MPKDNPQIISTERASESIYTAEEFAQNSEVLFGHGRDIVAAALDHAKIKSCTIEQARETIRRFAERKV